VKTKPNKFIQKSYNRSDTFAKDIFIKYAKFFDHKIIKKKEDYGMDVITSKDGKKYYFELELLSYKPFINSQTFFYKNVSFLERKKRLHKKNSFNYVIICYETGYAVTCFSDEIFKEKYYVEQYINSKERKGIDKFYRVPKNKCKFLNLNVI